MKSEELEQIRQRMSQTDDRIIRLLAKRAELAREVGRIKEQNGLEVYDPAREAVLMGEFAFKFQNAILPVNHLRAIYREIISACRELQRPVTVACLGPAASFTHLAAQSHFGGSTTFAFQTTISQVFDEMERDRVSLGVVPVENTFEGSVNFTLDRLIQTPVKVIGEIYQRIRHCLLSTGSATEEIRRVYSHPQAFAQCQDWLRRKLPDAEYVDMASTAAAAQKALK